MLKILQQIIKNNYKNCTQCGFNFPANDEFFYKQKRKNKDGVVFYILKAECKECGRKNALERTKNKEYQEKQKKYHSHWSIQNRDREAENKRRLRKENPEHYKEYFKNYQSNNISKFSDYARKREANKKFIITKKEWESCKTYFNHSCAYCRMTEDEHRKLYKQQLHKEHVINNGKNNLKNCVPSCKECNSQKSEYSLHTWYNEYNMKYREERYSKIYTWIRYDANKSMRNFQIRF